jgi:glucan-binding YG repeat protein
MANQVPKDILLAAGAIEQLRNRKAEADKVDEDESQSKQQTIAALGAIQAAGGLGASQSDLQSQVLQALLQNLNLDMADKQAKKAAEKEQLERQMRAQCDNVKHEKERQKASQDYCSHQKENGRSRIGGQRLSNGHYAYLCGYCHKEYDETTLPSHLQISMELVGG